MRPAGHTMSTPEFTVEEALEFFASLGLPGAEVVVQTGYRSGIPYEADDRYVLSLRKKADSLGIQIVALTPYLSDYNSLDEQLRIHDCTVLKRVIDMAHILGAGSIRIYGGAFKDDEVDENGDKLRQLVSSLRECGDYANRFDIKLSIENHFGTMATTAKNTMNVINAVNHPAVGVLYDQANLAFFPAEEYKEAIDLQKGHITWVHVKDLVYRGGKSGGLLQYKFIPFSYKTEYHRAEPVSGIPELGIRCRFEIRIDHCSEHTEIPSDHAVGETPFLRGIIWIQAIPDIFLAG